MSLLQTFLGAALHVGLSALGRTRRPKLTGELRLTGLSGPVEIARDRWGVPHIYAYDAHDLLFAQGFVHAQDRLWQMDFQRRLTAGRLAEVLGPAALPADRGIRILGVRRAAEAELSLLSAEASAELEAYAAGVNACMAHQPLPVEFALLRYRPEPWTPADSLSWAKMMAWSLSINWETELLRAALIERLGPTLAAELEPGPPPHWPTVMDPTLRPDDPTSGPAAPENTDRRRLTGGAFSSPAAPFAARATTPDIGRHPERNTAIAEWSRRMRSHLDRLAAEKPGFSAAMPSTGSNNWVVAGWRSTTGKPLLANDMHLLMSAPAIWYENHLVISDRPDHDEGASLSITGVSFPGIPYIVAGHNGHVAWGFTNGFPDVQDLYMERLRRTADSRVQYLFRGEWLDAEVRNEVIHVKGSDPVNQTVILTRHGPIINALAPGLAAEVTVEALPTDITAETAIPASPLAHPLALRWTALAPDSMFDALRAMNRARSCAEFREALRGWTVPTQNVVYADTQGNIAYTYAGRIPIRGWGDGSVPVPGWDGEHEWTGYIPFEELPHQLNPACGYIASANNRATDERYPHFLSREFSMGDRAERIVALLQARSQVDTAFFRQMQLDQVSSTMQAIGRHLGALASAEPDLAEVVVLVQRWDGRLTADSPAAAVCQVFARLMIKVMLEGRLGDLTERVLGKGPTPVLQEASFFAERAMEWLLHILAQPESHWFDLGRGEKREDVMRIALRRTVAYLQDHLGPPEPDFRNWAWGRLHTLTFGHLAGQVPALTRHFNRGPFPLGGDGNTIWATGNGLTLENSTAVVGPPFRFIADLSDLDHCWGCLAPGNSGRPDSPHYDDQIEEWFKGEHHPMLYAREEVARGTVTRLRLGPSRHKSSYPPLTAA